MWKLSSRLLVLLSTILLIAAIALPASPVAAQEPVGGGNGSAGGQSSLKDKITQFQNQKAAGQRLQALRNSLAARGGAQAAVQAEAAGGASTAAAIIGPDGKWLTDYFGVANWANSPALTKFVDKLPGLGTTAANALGQYIPVAVADTTTYASTNSDYYEIAVVEYKEQLHSELPATTLRGYVQLETNVIHGAHVALTNPDGTAILMPDGTQAYGVDRPHYLGPAIVATGALTNSDNLSLRNARPVRMKFYNLLPAGAGGDLFLPVDTTVMGAGMGPAMDGGGNPIDYTQNRATVHLHGNNTVWISDGTPHQWITPDDETTPYPKGVSVVDVPDMPPAGEGAMTIFYSNAMSARLMFYHDHAFGITRLNVYAGEAAGYVVTDAVEQDLINGTNDSGVNPGGLRVLPDIGIPLVIQDKSFVDPVTIGATDPTWLDPLQTTFGTSHRAGGVAAGTPVAGDLWYPHVYMPAQNPWALDGSGTNPFGRWMYGPWFYPPTANLEFGPVPNEFYDPVNAPWEPPQRPGTPNPSMPGEAFMDTMMVNGTVYPYLDVDPKAYRFRILNAANDRFVNLQLYVAESGTVYPLGYDGPGNAGYGTEVKMVPVTGTDWLPPFDFSGVPDPATKGPDWIQIGTEGGFLPAPVVIPSQPTTWNTNPTTFNFGTVNGHSLLLGSAERADVIVDFSQYAGQTLILYNDAPAAFPAPVPTYDYYTNSENLTDVGGAEPTKPGFGPNTRTVMQIRVSGASGGLTVSSVNVNSGGGGYGTPVVTFVSANTTTAATGTATGSVDRIALAALGSGYASAPTVTIAPPTTGTQATATATVTAGMVTGFTITNPGSGYTEAPLVTLSGAGGASAKATLAITSVNVTSPGGYTAVPMVVISDSTGSGAGATASATMTPAGGAPAAYDLAALRAAWAKGPGAKRGVFEVSLDPIIVPQAEYNSAYGKTGVGTDTFPTAPEEKFLQVNTYSKTITPIDASGALQTPVTLPIQLKGAHDEMGGVYDTEYGRMSGMLGLEIPATTSQIAQFLPYGYSSPPIDIMAGSIAGSMIGSLDDGTQIWNLIHNGVDTHTIHTHLFTAQLLNRVGWDGIMLPPDPNELGWKETFRMNPLEQIIIALRPILPTADQIPFLDQVPNSVRLIDPTKSEGALLDAPPPAGWFDTNGVSIPSILNHYVNFGWEYVYHCHLLAHEEMDMMHGTAFVIPPVAPANLQGAASGGPRVVLTWTDNSLNETGFTVQRAADSGFSTIQATFHVGPNVANYTDTSVIQDQNYFYRVFASNTVGDSVLAGFPTVTMDSPFSNVRNVAVGNPPAAPSNLTVQALRFGANDLVVLRWTDNSNNEQRFRIQRATNAAFTLNLDTRTVGPNTVVWSQVVGRNTNYYYRIQSYNVAGPSAWVNATPFPILTP